MLPVHSHHRSVSHPAPRPSSLHTESPTRRTPRGEHLAHENPCDLAFLFPALPESTPLTCGNTRIPAPLAPSVPLVSPVQRVFLTY